MIGEVTAQVMAVTPRQSRDGTKTMYDIALSDGQTYTAFDANLASKAHGFLNQQVQARVEAKPNNNGGHYLNLKDIGAPGTLPAMAAPLPSGATPMFGAPQPAAFPGGVGVGPPFAQPAPVAAPLPAQAPRQSEYTPEVVARIVRSTAIETAAVLLAGVYEGAGDEFPWSKLWTVSAAIAHNIHTGLTPTGNVAAPEGVTPAGVAAQVPGVQVGVAPPEAQPVAAGGQGEFPEGF